MMSNTAQNDAVKRILAILELLNFRANKLGLEQKLDHHSSVEFHGDSDGNGFKAQNPMIDPLIGPN